MALFVEKYRPTELADVILSKEAQKVFEDILTKKEIPNLLLVGSAGVGKTTVAKILCDKLGYDVLFINASEQGNIDTLRTSIRQFASTRSMHSAMKCVILDEADHLNPQSTQPALRGFIEEFHESCRFIMTCNFLNKIIDPLQSRFAQVNFNIPKAERAELALRFLERLKKILEIEKITCAPKVLTVLTAKTFPDFRRTLNAIQKYSSSGTIDEGVLSLTSTTQINEVFNLMKVKDFTGVRRWVAINDGVLSPDHVIRGIFDLMDEKCAKPCIPNVCLILADGLHKLAFTSDPQVTLTAILANIMLEATFV
jgi:replication factor C small subunit